MRPGFKQTDVGEIPEDWGVSTLGDIGESLIGLTYNPADIRAEGTLVLRSSNIRDGTLRFEDNVFVNTEIPERIMVRPGDILVCVRNGSRDLIGKCAKLDERAIGMTFGAFMAVYRSPLNQFIYHQFSSFVIKRQIHEHLGATINQITNKSLNSFRVPLPPTSVEREAMASTLGDADAFIESLEQLIAKKRQIKQGAMQVLLTGKKRLPGFNGKWEATSMENCFALIDRRNKELNDNVVTISAQKGFVRQEEFFNKRVASSVLQDYYLVERDEFAYNRGRAKGYPFGAIKRLKTYDKAVVTTLYICFSRSRMRGSIPNSTNTTSNVVS